LHKFSVAIFNCVGGSGGKMGEEVVRCWPNELIFNFGGSYVCADFGENR